MTSVQTRADSRGSEDRSLGDLLRALTAELQGLFRAELQLAKIEAREELDQVTDTAKHGAIAAGAAVMAVLLLSFAAAWGLAEVMPAGVAFLIVGAVYAIVAIVAGLAAREGCSISGAEWADVSFPGFFALLRQLGAGVEIGS